MIKIISKSLSFPSSVTVGYIPNKYVFEANVINGTLWLGGIEGKFLDLISKALGFKCHLKYPLDREIELCTKMAVGQD